MFNELLLAETFMICIPALIRCEKIDIIKQTIEKIEWDKRSIFLDEDKLKKYWMHVAGCNIVYFMWI